MTREHPHESVHATMARAEFLTGSGKRVHREPRERTAPAVVVGPYDTCHAHSFRPRPPQKLAVPEFTVRYKNDLGTSQSSQRLSLNELRRGQIQLASSDGRSWWGTTSGSDFVQPREGRAIRRGGIAPRGRDRRQNSKDPKFCRT